MPLYLARPNQWLEIKRISGTDKVKSHLENLGFIIGESVMLISMIDNDVIVKVKGVSMAISRDLAKRILV